jgi:hypothetical protein
MPPRPSGRAAPRLAVECLEDRTVPTFLPRTGPSPALVNGSAFPPAGTGGLSVALGDLVPDPSNFDEYVLGTGPGTAGLVTIYDFFGNLKGAFFPFGGYSGGINVAVGDVTGDSRPEIVVTTAGSGPSAVGVFSAAGLPLAMFTAFNGSNVGGLNVAVANVIPDIGQTPTTGAPGQPNAKSEIVVGAAGAPMVQVFNAAGVLRQAFMTFAGQYAVGATVAAANIDNFRSTGNLALPDTNAYAEIVVGAASFLPLVEVYKASPTAPTAAPKLIERYLAFDLTDPLAFTGVTVAAGDTDNNPSAGNPTAEGSHGAEIFVAHTNSSRIRTFAGDSGLLEADVQAFPPDYSRVVNMAVGNPFGIFNQGAMDLAVVAGDGPFQQRPRLIFGFPGRPAGQSGP